MTKHYDKCPACGGPVVYYTLGAPGIGGGWACTTLPCRWDAPDAGNRILTPGECR